MKKLNDISSIDEAIDRNKSYDKIIETLQECQRNEIPVDEGVMKAIIGGLTGMTIAPAIMKAVCEIIGVDPKGQFGNLLTSRLVLTALGVKLGLDR